MDWLVGYDCSCDAESLAWETMAKAYRDPNFDVVRLAEIRGPRSLGRVLHEHPALGGESPPILGAVRATAIMARSFGKRTVNFPERANLAIVNVTRLRKPSWLFPS
jgi:hypothetical protein